MKHQILVFLTFVFGTLNILAQVPSPDVTIELNSSNGFNAAYSGQTFTGTAYILYANPTKKRITKPFIICDGFDPADDRDYYTNKNSTIDTRGLYQLLNGDNKNGTSTLNLIPQLKSLCYDIIIVNWHRGGGFIQGNAALYIEFIKYINSINTSAEKSVMVGPSMGGLITRFALAKMEKDGIAHNVRVFISFDSPQTGAVIPLSIQHMLDDMANIPIGGADAQAAIFKLNSDAAKQMLVNHYTATNFPNPNQPKAHPYRQQLINDLNSFGNNGYPKNVRMIAISNGSGDPKNSGLVSGQLLVNFQANAIVLGQFLTAQAYSFGRSDNFIYAGNIIFGGPNNIFNSNGSPNYDGASGGQLDLPGTLNHNSANIANISNLPNTSCFIPTASAFGLPLTTSNLYLDWKNPFLPEYYYIYLTPFDDLFLQTTDQEHITISSSTAAWMISQITYGVNNQQSFSFDAYSFVSTPSPYHFFMQGKDFNFSIQSTVPNPTIASGAEMTLRASEKIILNNGFVAANGSSFVAQIMPTTSACYSNLKRKVEISPIRILPDSTKINPTQQNNIIVYPNPTAGIITVETTLNLQLQNMEFVFYDLIGRECYRSKLTENKTILNFSDLALENGIYCYSIITNGKTFSQDKLVVIK